MLVVMEKFRRAFPEQTTGIGRFVTCDIGCVFLSSSVNWSCRKHAELKRIDTPSTDRGKSHPSSCDFPSRAAQLLHNCGMARPDTLIGEQPAEKRRVIRFRVTRRLIRLI
jgi:hypothetical protein